MLVTPCAGAGLRLPSPPHLKASSGSLLWTLKAALSLQKGRLCADRFGCGPLGIRPQLPHPFALLLRDQGGMREKDPAQRRCLIADGRICSRTPCRRVNEGIEDFVADVDVARVGRADPASELRDGRRRSRRGDEDAVGVYDVRPCQIPEVARLDV